MKNISRLNQFSPHYAIALFCIDVHFFFAGVRMIFPVDNSIFNYIRQHHFSLNSYWVWSDNGEARKMEKVMTSVSCHDCIFIVMNLFIYLQVYILWRQSRVFQSLVRQLSENQMVVLENDTRLRPLPFLQYFF